MKEIKELLPECATEAERSVADSLYRAATGELMVDAQQMAAIKMFLTSVAPNRWGAKSEGSKSTKPVTDGQHEPSDDGDFQVRIA